MDMTTRPHGLIYGIYDQREPGRIRYIGQTVNLDRRKRTHLNAGRNGGKGKLYCWMSSPKHLPEFVAFKILQVGIAPGKDLDDAERQWIANLRLAEQSDLNMTDGGYGCRGYSYSLEQRAEMSRSRKGRLSGEKGPKPKLTWAAVSDIRELRTSEWVSEAVLAERYGIQQSTLNKMLRNMTWVDPTFDPSELKTRPPETHRNNFSIGWEKVCEIRAFRQTEWISDVKCATKFGVTHSIINAIINNDKWYDPEFDVSTIKKNGVGGRRNTKITAADVIEIRRRVKAGEFQRIIGEDFGLAQPQVGRIARGDRWGHIKEGL